ncbi:MAG: cytochrome c5 family protein [Betaproteobacteria bacterium]|nr:cytochrome c5 family protein [Betaproteobacteria bacterium]
MAEIHVEEHSSPIKTPKQLVIVILLAFLVPITLIVMLSQLVTSGGDFSKNNPGMSDEAIARRIKPAGEVVIDPTQPKPEPAAPATVAAAALAVPAAAPSKGGDAAKGKAVYEAVCAVCHLAGVAGAPKAGDRAAWAPRLKAGTDALYASSLKGKNAMPPKGGNLSLADADVKAAVDYLVGSAR